MIKLENISKTYLSETKQEVHALKGVNFEVGSCGMVFILGKSGSGKSTLLNLLGGLDSPSQGEITVDGVSMKNFSQADYESYRNSFVGFIFQEYNLLGDLNVQDNVALALQLSHGENATDKVTNALRQVQLDEEYLTRHVDEMSGGEKQRVAIARAIVKDSKVILADEPTGNLDSMTGESIWEILKNLSQEKLVVVVSHDRDSAEKYGDRIIEIADGEVIADNGAPTVATAQTEHFTSSKKRIPFKVCLKMSARNLLQHKMRSISLVILSVLCGVALLLAQICVFFSAERTAARYIKRYNVPYFEVDQGSDDGGFSLSGIGSDATREFVASRAQYLFTIGSMRWGCTGFVRGSQDILDFGLSFVGNYLQLDSQSYYVSKQALMAAYADGRSYYVDEDNGDAHVPLVKELHPAEFLVGKRVYIDTCVSSDTGDGARLAGVVDTDKVDVISRGYIPDCFSLMEFEYSGSDGFFVRNDLYFGNKLVTSARYYCSFQRLIPSYEFRRTLMLDNESGEGVLKSDEEITLADDEIIITYELYEKLFKSTFTKFDYVDLALSEVKLTPEQLGQSFELAIKDDDGNERLYFGEYKLVGILFTKQLHYEGYGDGGMCVMANSKTINSLETIADATYLIRTDSVRNLSGFLAKLRSNYMGYVKGAGLPEFTYRDDNLTNNIANIIYYFVDESVFLTPIFGAIGLILLVVMVLLTVNMISYSITARKQEIGVLSALGTSNKDINKIFLLETLLVSVVSVVLSIVGVLVAAHFFNSLYSVGEYGLVEFFRVDVLTVALAFVVTVGFQLLATLIPLRRINKMKPVDAIRDN